MISGQRLSRYYGRRAMFISGRLYLIMRGRKYRLRLLCCVIVAVFLLTYVHFVWFPEHGPVYQFQNSYYDTPCMLPHLDPFDPSIRDFFWVPDPLKCDKGFPPLVYVDDKNRIRYNDTVLQHLLPDIKQSDIQCLVSGVVRNRNDEEVEFVKSDISVSIDSKAVIPEDFTHVQCETKTGKLLYDNILTGIKEPMHTDPGMGRSKQTLESREHLSVYLIGLDSVSRSASLRYLPKTREVLKELGAYDFQGLMKVGDNTLPNVISLLSGLKLGPEEMPDYAKKPFDGYPFIWKNFTDNGYTTFYAEDMPHFAPFNIKPLRGLESQPTDHFMRPFWLGLNQRDKTKYKLQNVYRFLEDKGLKIGDNSVFCNQNTKNHIEMINFFKQFVTHYNGRAKFGLAFWTELAHTFINFLHYGDQDFADLFLWLQHGGFLNNSVVIFFSDHGSRFNSLRNTYIGRMECRMPMLYILLPDHIKSKYPSLHRYMNLNTKRLVTHYDIYQTMLDIVHGNYNNPSIQKIRGRSRGISLFGEIPGHRSCAGAWIPREYCTCYKRTPLNTSGDKTISKLCKEVVRYINNRLTSEKGCKQLELNNILSAEKMALGLQYQSSSWFSMFFKPEGNRATYSVTIETKPGFATFDATIDVDASGFLTVQPDIDRTNEYGNQSACVGNRELRQFCYC